MPVRPFGKFITSDDHRLNIAGGFIEVLEAQRSTRVGVEEAQVVPVVRNIGGKVKKERRV